MVLHMMMIMETNERNSMIVYDRALNIHNQATNAWRTLPLLMATEASMFTLDDDTQVFCITHK